MLVQVFASCCIETVDISVDRLTLLLLDGVEIVRPLLLPLATDKVADERSAQIFEGVDGAGFKLEYHCRVASLRVGGNARQKIASEASSRSIAALKIFKWSMGSVIPS